MQTLFSIGALALFAVSLTVPADAATLKCQRAIAKAGAQYTQARAGALAKCEGKVVTGSGTSCPDATATQAIAKASAKLTTTIGKACGGDDNVCGGDLTNEDAPATLGWPDRCPNFERGGCGDDIADCGGIASCLTCLDDAAVDQAMGLYYDALALPSSDALNKCQVAIGKATTAFLESKSKALQKCWDARMNGKFPGTCIPPDAGDGKYEAAISKAEAKKRNAICKACGGSDGLCDGVDDIAPPSIGFPADCPAVTIPGGTACGGPITDLDSLVDCVDCVTEFKVDCVDRAQVPQLAAYPSECNVCTQPAPTGPCPTSMEFTVDGPRSDLDLGFMGLAHDVQSPDDSRLTFAVSGCAGANHPTCGECAADGPIANAGGAAFDNHRCQDQPWVSCGTDGDCPLAGATGPCVYFFGPPQPFSGGGIPNCLVNRITGPIAGTVNVDTGSTTLPTTLASSLYLVGPQEQPCPICDQICIGGSDAGTACSSAADCDSNDCSATTLCSAGPRMHQACSQQGTTPLGATSLDCPPNPGALATTRTVTLQLATGVQSQTLTAASPPCRQTGFTSLTCFCDTCNNINQEGCFAHVDCPANGGGPGICGGRRCLGGSEAGQPCRTCIAGSNHGAQCATDSACPGGTCMNQRICNGGANDGAACQLASACPGGTCSECAGGVCNRPGEATQPNSCQEDTSTPESGCVAAGGDEGECADGPFDGRCAIDTQLWCGDSTDCNPPPTGGCQGCVPGQACVARARSCFTGNGIIGDSVTMTGSAEAPCGVVAQPTIGALFCVPPSSASFVDAQGYPGLGRMKLPGQLTFTP